jgi:hypothetical protein
MTSLPDFQGLPQATPELTKEFYKELRVLEREVFGTLRREAATYRPAPVPQPVEDTLRPGDEVIATHKGETVLGRVVEVTRQGTTIDDEAGKRRFILNGNIEAA